METKQTVVDFLEESIRLHCLINDYEDVMIDYNTLDKLFMKARAMEKEQIIDAYLELMCDEYGYEVAPQGWIDNAEQYYKETYGK